MERTPQENRSYMSVDAEYLRRAFSLASALSQDFDTPRRERRQFQKIASLIWQSCGESESGVGIDNCPNPKPRTGDEAEAAGRAAYTQATLETEIEEARK
jgi:hypothetical protein